MQHIATFKPNESRSFQEFYLKQKPMETILPWLMIKDGSAYSAKALQG